MCIRDRSEIGCCGSEMKYSSCAEMRWSSLSRWSSCWDHATSFSDLACSWWWHRWQSSMPPGAPRAPRLVRPFGWPWTTVSAVVYGDRNRVATHSRLISGAYVPQVERGLQVDLCGGDASMP